MADDTWTVPTLKAHFDAILEERRVQTAAALASAEKAVEAALAAAEKATEKAETAQRVHDSGANEFRSQLKDQVATFPTRRELDEAERRIGVLETVVSNLQGRAMVLATGAAAFGALIGAVASKAFG